MKELTKSLFSYSLAIGFFGLKQMDNLMSATPRGERQTPAVKSFDSVTCATTSQFGDTLNDAFQAADNFQRGFVELAFNVMFPFAASSGSSRTSKDRTERRSAAEPRLWSEVAVDPNVYSTTDPEPLSASGRLA